MGIVIIKGEPVPKARPRFGNGRMFTPKKSHDYEVRVAEEYKAQHGEIFGEEPIDIEIRAYFRIPTSAPLRRQRAMKTGMEVPTKRPDLDNIVKSITDGLNGVAYPDDKFIVSIAAMKEYAEEPRVEVEITTHYGGQRNEPKQIDTGLHVEAP